MIAHPYTKVASAPAEGRRSALRPYRGSARRPSGGWTLVELLVVMALIAVAVLIGALSVYRGKAAADQLACQDHMRAIHSALQVYYIKNNRTYPANQAVFDQFLGSQSGAYFGGKEPRCPLDTADMYHYRYSYNAATGVITITCPVPNSGHGPI